MSKKAQFRAPPKVCPYCCKPGVSSKDHIPPRVFLLASAKQEQQDQFITIKCCPKCNEGFSELDTLFAEFVSIWLGVNNPSWQRLWDENVLPTILGNHRRHTELIQGMEDIVFPTPSGDQVRRSVITLDDDIPRRMCARLLRGLYFRDFKKPLPIDVDIASDLYRDLEDFSEILSKLTKKNIGRQFTYWVFHEQASPFDTMWFFDFHGGLCAMAGSGAGSSIITKDPIMSSGDSILN